MNSPSHDDQPVDQLSSAEEEQVRRLLADARADEPIPQDVADRMDATLADLGREREARHAGVPVAERPAGPISALSSRRRRVVGGLVAAAVVAVVGIGIGQVVIGSNETREAATSGGADRSDTAPEDEALSAEREDAAEPEAAVPSGADDRASGSLRAVDVRKVDQPIPVVGADRLHRDALRVRRDLVPAGGARAALYDGTLVISPVGFKCASAVWGDGTLVGVEYDGRLAMLAYREPTGEQQVAEVLQCGTGDLLRSTSIPAP